MDKEGSEGHTTVALPVRPGGGSEQGDGEGQEARARKENLKMNNIKTKNDKTNTKSYKLTKITDYVQGKQIMKCKEQRSKEGLKKEERKEATGSKEGQETPGGGGKSCAVKVREELLVPVAPPHHPLGEPGEDAVGPEVKEEEPTLLQKMRLLQARNKGGEKGKSPRNNIGRKHPKKEEKKQKEDPDDMKRMRKMLEGWRKEPEKQKPREAPEEDLQNPLKKQVLDKLTAQEEKGSVRNKIRKYSIRDKVEKDSYEAWKAARKEGRKRKASEEESTSTKKRQNIDLTRVIETKSEMGRKPNLNLKLYLACSAGEGGGGRVQGGAAEVHDGRVQAEVQSAQAKLNNWQTRLGGKLSANKKAL